MKILFVFILLLAVIVVINITGSECGGPYITFALDDGYLDHYIEGFPIFEKYDMKATAYIPSELVGKTFDGNIILTWEQLNELKSAGWEIGSHGVDHKDLSLLNSENVENEMIKSKEEFKRNGIEAETFAVPYGKYNEIIKDIAKKHFIAVRPSVWGNNNLNGLDKYNLKSFWITNTTSLNSIRKWISEGNKDGIWTILMVHFVRENISDEYTITPQDLDNVLAYTKSENIEVKTVSEVVKMCGG